MRSVTTEQMRRIEAAAVARGLEYLRLMENAGSAAARYIREHYRMDGASVVILCGCGNNGGDGFVIARRLQESGAEVTVVLADGEPRTPESREMLSRLDRAVIRITDLKDEPFLVTAALENADLVVDAIYGIGFHGTLPDHLGALFDRVHGRCPLIAIDVPSGLNANTGTVAPHTPKAAATVTFTVAKRGMLMSSAVPYCGHLAVVQIGIDEELIEREAASGREIDESLVRAYLPPRDPESHKGTFGKVLSVGGQYGMSGAAFFAAKAALRCGAGLVTAAVPHSIYPILASMLPEAVFLPLPETDGHIAVAARSVLHDAVARSQAVVMGCGLGVSEDTLSIMEDILTHATCPVVLDADGINMLAQHIDILKTEHAPLILTPHVGEMARLCGLSVQEIQSRREEVAVQWAQKLNVTLVLKGYRTVVAASNGQCWVNPTGNAGMATGGSGDLLAGMIGSFCAQGLSPDNAALCGVYLHGLAGDRAAQRLSQTGLLPSDLLEELPHLFTN